LRAKILGEKILADARFRLTITEAEVIEADGARRILKHEVYHYKPAAAVLLYDPSRGVVMLVKQFRLGAFIEGAAQPLIEVCAGMLDGDDPKACVIREASEETGVRILDARHAFDAFVSPGGSTEKISCFTARYAAADRIAAGGGVDADERIEIVERPLDEALDMIERGEICDAKTISLLYFLQTRGLMKG